MAILVLNAGSSNLKAAVFEVEGKNVQDKPIWTNKVSWKKNDLDSCQSQILELLKRVQASYQIDFVGHRVVHGGDKYFSCTLIDQDVLNYLHELEELAPLHEPVSINAIESVYKIWGDTKQFAVFDTAFHAQMPESSKIYPLPYEWYQNFGIHRFGFHGISHQYCAQKAASMLEKPLEQTNLISCHLGNGASLCAVNKGKSAFTTMGFTPMDGIVMGTRSGSIDPGIILHLLKKNKMTLSQLEEVLNEDSGLKGICNQSDMQEIEKLVLKGDANACLALDIFCQSLARAIAGLFTCLESVDAIIFTGGIGENSIQVRERVLKTLDFAGVQLNAELNRCVIENDFSISSKQSLTKVFVIQSKEELAIARECLSGISAST